MGLSFGVHMGIVTGDEPELRGKVDNGSISQSDVDKEVDEIEKREKFGEKYSTVSIIGLYLGYNF